MTFAGWDGVHDGQENMARDRSMLESVVAGRPVWRVYGWDGPWVSLGFSQDPFRALVAGCPVPWVKRPTGGKGVLHGHDLTFSLAVSLEDLGLPEQSRDVKTVYETLAGVLVSALNRCGMEVGLGSGSGAGGATSDCFAYSSANDIVSLATGTKIAGCAQVISNSGALLQASIPVKPPIVDPATVFPYAAPSLWSPVDQAVLVEAINVLEKRGFWNYSTTC